MNKDTKRWVLSGNDAQNQAGLLDKIDAAEVQKLLHYELTFQDGGGGFYEIEYGLKKGSGVGKPD
jgi:hypothetical protein